MNQDITHTRHALPGKIRVPLPEIPWNLTGRFTNNLKRTNYRQERAFIRFQRCSIRLVRCKAHGFL